LKGVSIRDNLLLGQNTVFARVSATAKKPASNTATIYLGNKNYDIMSSGNLISTNGKKLFGKDQNIQYIPAAGLTLDENGELKITGKQKWKTGTLSIPAEGADYYLRSAPSGITQPGKPVKMTVKQGDEWQIDSNAKPIKTVKAPSVKFNSAQDAITLKVGMEVLNNKGEWLKVSANQNDPLYYNPAIKGVSLYDAEIAESVEYSGGIVYRKSADSKKPVSDTAFIALPKTDATMLNTEDFTSVDGKKINLTDGELQYIKVSDAPTSILKDGILKITDKKAKWKKGQISIGKGDKEFYVRLASGSFNNQSRVIKINIESGNIVIIAEE
jgi:hypothetical protein